MPEKTPIEANNLTMFFDLLHSFTTSACNYVRSPLKSISGRQSLVSSISIVFISGTVTLSSFKLCSKIVASFLIKSDLLSTQSIQPFIWDRQVNRHLLLAFNVDSVRPPELVIRPLRTFNEQIGESRKFQICSNTNSALRQGKQLIPSSFCNVSKAPPSVPLNSIVNNYVSASFSAKWQTFALVNLKKICRCLPATSLVLSIFSTSYCSSAPTYRSKKQALSAFKKIKASACWSCFKTRFCTK